MSDQEDEKKTITEIDYDEPIKLRGYKPDILVAVMHNGSAVIGEVAYFFDNEENDHEYPTMILRHPYFFEVNYEENGDSKVRYSVFAPETRDDSVVFHMNSLLATYEPSESLETSYIYMVKTMGGEFNSERGDGSLLPRNPDLETEEEYNQRIMDLVQHSDYDPEMPN